MSGKEQARHVILQRTEPHYLVLGAARLLDLES